MKALRVLGFCLSEFRHPSVLGLRVQSLVGLEFEVWG